jgi:uncharacterized protein DUF6229
LHTLTQESAVTIAARWRTGADADSPAGPLYTAGKFAEADIAAPGRAITRISCLARTACTAQGSQCC